MWQHPHFFLWWPFDPLTWRAFSSGLHWCSTGSCSVWWSHLHHWFLSGSEGPVMWYWGPSPPNYGYHCIKENSKKKKNRFYDMGKHRVSLRETHRFVRPRMISRFSKGLSELMFSGHAWINKYPETIKEVLIMKVFSCDYGVLELESYQLFL